MGNGVGRGFATNVLYNGNSRAKVDRLGIVDKHNVIELGDVVDRFLISVMCRGEGMRVPYASIINNVIVQKQRAAAVEFAHGKQHKERYQSLSDTSFHFPISGCKVKKNQCFLKSKCLKEGKIHIK